MTHSGVDGRDPHSLVLLAERDRLYAASEVCDFEGGRAFLTRLQTCSSAGAGPAYVQGGRSGRWLFVANDVEGNISSCIHEKAGCNKPLTTMQQEFNRIKSTARCRIEHIFGWVENSMGGPELECSGLARISTGIGSSHLAYNLRRYAQLIRPGRVPAAGQCA